MFFQFYVITSVFPLLLRSRGSTAALHRVKNVFMLIVIYDGRMKSGDALGEESCGGINTGQTRDFHTGGRCLWVVCNRSSTPAYLCK